MSATTSAAGIAWELGDLYQGYDDPALPADIDQVTADAEAFASAYRGTINVPDGPTAAYLLQALQQLESLYDRLARPVVFASLLFAADTSKPEHRNLQQHMEQRSTAIRNSLLFFHLEWMQLEAAVAQRLIDDPALQPYRHYLRTERRYESHTLSELEERMINEKDITGTQAWQNFFTELISSQRFSLERDGETQQLELASVLTLMRHPERSLRQRAFASLFDTLGSQGQTLAYIFNTLWQDHLTMNRLRNYSDPMSARHLSNDIDAESVNTMMGVVEQNYDIAHSYFALKARLLGLPCLQMYDQYAPIGQIPAGTSYSQAQAILLGALDSFDSRFREIASMFFEGRWIDAEVRPGKRGGAFCNGYPPSSHPYVLCNYTDDLRDVMTLAHELGHGIHFWLAREQSLFNFYPTLPLAETASVFAEMLVFDHLLDQQQDPQARLALVCNKIEDIFATVFRQNVLTRFEQAAFAGRTQGRLTPEQINDYWLQANQRYYGQAVEQTPGYELGWSYIPHFIHTPFYCYSYVFGELLVLALYSIYREQGAAFVPQYTALLQAGSSRSPAEMLAELGVDIRDAGFWQRGFAELRRLVGWAQELATT